MLFVLPQEGRRSENSRGGDLEKRQVRTVEEGIWRRDKKGIGESGFRVGLVLGEIQSDRVPERIFKNIKA